MPTSRNFPDILVIAARARSAGLTQGAIANAVCASQSQVSRILSGKSRRRSKLYVEICEYVKSRIEGVSPNLVKENEELINALASVWDGTSSQSVVLAEIIRSLGPLCLARHPATGNPKRGGA